MENTLLIKHLLKHPSVMIFLGLLAGFTLLVVGLAEGAGIGLISTSFVKTLGKTFAQRLHTSQRSPREKRSRNASSSSSHRPHAVANPRAKPDVHRQR